MLKILDYLLGLKYSQKLVLPKKEKKPKEYEVSVYCYNNHGVNIFGEITTPLLGRYNLRILTLAQKDSLTFNLHLCG
jgi:hypothetical protein